MAKSALDQALGMLGGALSGAVHWTGNEFGQAGNLIGNQASNLGTTAHNIAQPVAQAVQQAPQTVSNFAGQEANNFRNWVPQEVAPIVSTAGASFGNIFDTGAQDAGALMSGLGQAANNVAMGAGSYFDPYQSGSNGFWSENNPIAQGLAAIQPHAENILQGATLGYYQPNPADEAGINPIVRGLEVGGAGLLPFLGIGALTGGIGDAALAGALGEDVMGSLGANAAGRFALGTAGSMLDNGLAGGIVGLAQNPGDKGDRLQNALAGGEWGAGFGALGKLPWYAQAFTGGIGGYAGTKLTGGSDTDAQINGMLGALSPVGFKTIDAISGLRGGETTGESPEQQFMKLYQNHGENTYTLLANKDLIQRVVTGQGSPEDIKQFNVLNDLRGGANVETGSASTDASTTAAHQGAAWDFLRDLFPDSFTQDGAPTSDFTNPDKTPLNSLSEITLTPEENQQLQNVTSLRQQQFQAPTVEQTQERLKIAQDNLENTKYYSPDQARQDLVGKLFTPDEVQFMTQGDKITTEDGRLATGKYLDSLIHVVENQGKVADTDVYHESFHAYTDKFADPSLKAGAVDEAKQIYGASSDHDAEEWLADKFATYMREPSSFMGKVAAFFHDLNVRLQSLVGRASNTDQLFQAIKTADRPVGENPASGQLSNRISSSEELALKTLRDQQANFFKLSPEEQSSLKATLNPDTTPPSTSGSVPTDNRLAMDQLKQIQAKFQSAPVEATTSSPRVRVSPEQKQLVQMRDGFTQELNDTKAKIKNYGVTKQAEGPRLQVNNQSSPEETQLQEKLLDTAGQLTQAQDMLTNYDLYKGRYTDLMSKTNLKKQISQLQQTHNDLQKQIDAYATERMNPSQGAQGYMSKTELQAYAKELQGHIKTVSTMLAKIKPAEKTQTTTPEGEVSTQADTLPQVNSDPIRLSNQANNGAGNENTSVPTQPETPITPTALADHTPQEGWLPGFEQIANNLLDKVDKNYGSAGRNFVRTVMGRINAGKTLGDNLEKAVKQQLPDLASRVKVQYALGESVNPETGRLYSEELTPSEKQVYDQIQSLNNIVSDIRSKYDPNYKPLEGYSSLYAIRPGANATQGLKVDYSKLNPNTPETLHREIRKFVAADGSSTKIGRAQDLGLTAHGSTYEDATGNQFLPTKATQKEIEDAGIMQYQTDVGKVMSKNIASAFKLKENSEAIDTLKNSGKYTQDVSSSPLGKNWKQVQGIPGLDGLYFSPRMANALDELTFKQDNRNPLTKGFDNASAAVRSLIFYNFITHSLNMTTNAIIGAGKAGGPLGVAKFIPNVLKAAHDVTLKSDNYIAGQKAGIGTGEFGQSASKPGIIERTLEHVTTSDELIAGAHRLDNLNPVRQLYRANTKLTGFIDDVMRQTLYNMATEHGQSEQEASKTVNDFLIDYGNVSNREKVASRFLIFYPWLKGNVGLMAKAGANPAAYAVPIATAAALYGAASLFEDKLKDMTGNPDASIRIPGALGVAKSIGEIPFNLKDKQVPNVLVQHINPILKEGLTQFANKQNLQDAFKPSGLPIVPNKPNQKQQPDELALRFGHALPNIVAPFNPLLKVQSDKKTTAEAVLNYLGVNLPHAKDYMADPNQPDATLPIIGKLNTDNPKAQSNGLYAIHTMDQVMKDFSSQDMQDYNALSGANAKTKDAIYAKNPKLWDAQAAIVKAYAKQDGTGYDPVYNYNSTDANAYRAYQGMSAPDKANYLATTPGNKVIQIEREQDAYKSSPDYQAYAKSQGWAPYIPNPVYSQFSNDQITNYKIYEGMPAKSQERTAFAAAHPEVYNIMDTEIPYYNSLDQQAWDTRPKGQTIDQFIATHKYVTGIDSNGNLTFTSTSGGSSGSSYKSGYAQYGSSSYRYAPRYGSLGLTLSQINSLVNNAASGTLDQKATPLATLPANLSTTLSSNNLTMKPIQPAPRISLPVTTPEPSKIKLPTLSTGQLKISHARLNPIV